MNSPERLTGISVKIFLLTISKLPPTTRVPKSMSRARFRNSRLGFADLMSIDGTLSSFRFESFLQYNKNIINNPNAEHLKLSLYWIYNTNISVVCCDWPVRPLGAFSSFNSINSKMWDLAHKLNVNEPVLLFFVGIIHYSCKLHGISENTDHVNFADHGLRHRHSLIWSLYIVVLVSFVCPISYKYNKKETKQIRSTTYTDMSLSIAKWRSCSASSDCSGTFWISFVSCKWACSTFIYQTFV